MEYHQALRLKDGRNPRGFRTRAGAWQALVLMRLALEGA